MKDIALSRTLSHALRHEPWLYELELDDEGWMPVAALINGLQETSSEWSDLGISDIERMIARSEKQRHELRGDRIRALYGHSTPYKLHKQQAVPPALLFHGTAPKTAEIVSSEGLKPMGRQYVHLSSDIETATKVGARKANTPVILQVDAATASAAGIRFYEGNDRVWLADEIPLDYILYYGDRYYGDRCNNP